MSSNSHFQSYNLPGKLSAPRDRRDAAVIGVPEVGRYDGQQMIIYRLEDGTYRVVDTSVVLPGGATQELARFVLLSTTMPHHAWFAAIQNRVHQR